MGGNAELGWMIFFQCPNHTIQVEPGFNKMPVTNIDNYVEQKSYLPQTIKKGCSYYVAWLASNNSEKEIIALASTNLTFSPIN